jgi:hypothetical protein
MFNLTTQNTTVLGICMILTALATAAVAIFDGDPATSFDLGTLIAAISGGLALIRVKVQSPPAP